MIRRAKIPTILGLLLLVVGLGGGIFLVQNRQNTRVGASDIAPQDVRITNVTDNSFSVSWITDRDTIGFVTYGETSSLGSTQVTDKSTASTVHYANVTKAKSTSTYYFKINSQGTTFDNNGIPWQVETGAEVNGQGVPLILSGKVTDGEQKAIPDAVIYIDIGGVQSLSTRTTSTGNWLLPLSTARASTLAEFASISKDASLVEVFVQAGSKGVANALIYPISANPMPPMVLGNTYDFKSVTGGSNETPSANLGLPNESTPSSTTTTDTQTGSGFNTSSLTTTKTTSTKKVSLDSVDNGEVITTTKPEFFGTGSPGVQFEIVLHSDEALSAKVNVTSTGSWKWSPPQNLTPGEHTVTLKWTDAAGILREITKSFIVQAADEPAFVSTPSATLKATASPSPTPKATTTPTPTATPKPTKSPTPIPTKKPTATPRVSVPSTESGIPVSGDTLPTIMLIGIALIFISGGAIAWKRL